MKRNIALLAILTALAAILALGTGAYFTASGQATNVVTTGTVSLSLDERRADGQVFPDLTADVLPGQSVSKIPYVVNTGSQPFYTRMLIQVFGEKGGESFPISEELVTLDLDTEHWAQGTDGWWYYRGEVAPGDKKAPFTQVTFSPRMGNEYMDARIVVSVTAQAVQSKNNPVPEGDYTRVAGWPAD